MPEIVLTADGSHSVYSDFFKEQYHSTHGALQESMHVFIRAGLEPLCTSKEEINLLEIGFGTGLNALLTALIAEENEKKIQYITIEKFPLDNDIYKQLDFCSIIQKQNCTQTYEKIYTATWNQEVEISPFFLLQKLEMNIESVAFNNYFDSIYFDAFSPTTQPELWTESIFKNMFQSLKVNGHLVTYCAKGEVKRTLKKVGFVVENLDGPKGKREMIIALKK